jgi:hypothetical protein
MISKKLIQYFETGEIFVNFDKKIVGKYINDSLRIIYILIL